MRLRKRSLVRIISFCGAVILSLGVWAGVATYSLAVIKRDVKASRERALTQLGTYMDYIDLYLQKAMYSSGEKMLSDVSYKLWRSSACAKDSLSEITDGETEVSGIYKFLSQVGEYTLSLNNKIASGKSITPQETDALRKLKKHSEELSATVNYLIEREENGTLDFVEVKSTLQAEEDDDKLYLSNELNNTNQAIEDYPTLVYDGPFSDHIAKKESELLKGLEEVSRDEAQSKAAEFLGVKKDDLLFLSKTDSNFSTYSFYNNEITVSVTQKGGLVSSLLSSGFAGETKLSPEDAVKKATAYLKEHGYKNIKESYYSVTDGICTVNFAFYEDKVTYYTDLIKVSVALDNGEITAFDATGYLMNHIKRVIPDNLKYTPETAKSLIKPELEILGFKKAYIPTEWETEVFTYEYHCRDKEGKEILVYINPVTGDEENILILLYSDNGILTK